MIQKYIQKLIQKELLQEHQLRTLCKLATQIFIEQSNIIKINAPIIICGDIHGQFYDLLWLFEKSGSVQANRYIFLGDYVDRGYNSVETISLLIAYKCKYPNNIYLLRGNHESKSLTQIYGFYDEILKKYGNPNPWINFIKLFNYLPLSALIQQRIFVVHGGLSPDIKSIDEIYQINRVVQTPEKGGMADLVWSDPQKEIQDWCINPRGAGYLFSQKVTKQFNKFNDIDIIVRSHQLVQQGYVYNFENEILLTIWSAPNYYYRCNNKAAVMKLDDKLQRKFIVYEASPQNKNNISNDDILPYFL